MRFRCFVPECKTGVYTQRKTNSEAGVRNKRLFLCPKDKDTLAKWEEAIQRQDKELTCLDAVCELHFTEDCIVRFFETIMPDGTVDKLLRGKPILRPGAIPSIFTHLPRDHSKMQKLRKQPPLHLMSSELVKTRQVNEPDANDTKRQIIWMQEELLEVTLKVDEETECNLQATASMNDEVFSDIISVKVPSKSWCASVLNNDTAVWFCFENHLATISRRVVISKEMSLRIFLWEKEVIWQEIEGIRQPESATDVCEILLKVDDLYPCELSYDVCIGYITRKPSGTPGKAPRSCLPCSKHHRKLKKRLTAEMRLRLFKCRGSKLRKLGNYVSPKANLLSRLVHNRVRLMSEGTTTESRERGGRSGLETHA